MSTYRWLLLGTVALSLVGCNPFNRSRAVEMSASDVNLNTRWHGNLASPAGLAGVVQMSGSATMTPAANRQMTDVRIDLANAAPGGIHPWGLYRGHCDAEEGLVGLRSAYKPMKIGNDGRASGVTNLPVTTPTSGRYSVRVTASSANADVVVACANLAPPSA